MKYTILLAAALTALGGCYDSAPHATNNIQQLQETNTSFVANGNLEQGRKIYNFRCYYCHGYSGNAKTLAASFLAPKPRDFTNTSLEALDKSRMLESIMSGRPGTAMKGFSSVLKPDEIEAVADFIRQEFMVNKAENTRYHTEANGWFKHERYSAAYPFALGEIPLDTPWEKLTPQQANGKRLYMTSCISCHDRARVIDESTPWEARPVSYPRNQYDPGDNTSPEDTMTKGPVDATTSASPYLLHERPPKLSGLSESELRGEGLFQGNCAFCHGADGTGRNWIGSFLEPHPRDLTNPEFMASMNRTRLRSVIRDGLKGTSMPAWKSVLSEQQIEDVIAYVGRAFHPLDPEQ